MRVKRLLMGALALGLLAGIGYGANGAHASTNGLNSYIKIGHYHPINNRNYTVSGSYGDNLNQDTNPDRHLTTVGGNWKDNYRPYATLTRQASDNPQSVVITPSGKTFVSYNLGDNQVQLVRYKETPCL